MRGPSFWWFTCAKSVLQGQQYGGFRLFARVLALALGISILGAKLTA
jgi:hypothetical protein